MSRVQYTAKPVASPINIKVILNVFGCFNSFFHVIFFLSQKYKLIPLYFLHIILVFVRCHILLFGRNGLNIEGEGVHVTNLIISVRILVINLRSLEQIIRYSLD